MAPGKYGARLILDTNNNEVWDTGSYKDKRQPEMVYYYPLSPKLAITVNDNNSVDMMELTDEQVINYYKQKRLNFLFFQPTVIPLKIDLN